MSLTQQITEDLKVAMKAKDQIHISCLRMLKTAPKKRQVEIGHESCHGSNGGKSPG